MELHAITNEDYRRYTKTYIYNKIYQHNGSAN